MSFPNETSAFLRAAWKAQTAAEKTGGVVTASGREYSLRRTVKFTSRKIEVADAITNTTAVPLGLLVRDEMDLSGLENPPVRLAGSTNPAMSENFSPGNPSVHVTAPDHTIALLCEDDVFRNQAKLYVKSAQAGSTPVAGLRTEMLRLAPNETYTLRWSVYPVASLDYFDFINEVREDWGANYTALGAWWWGFYPPAVLKMPLAELRAKLDRQGINYATIGGGWVDATKDKQRIGFGAGKERIIVTHDGHFGWDGTFRYRLWIYDGEGKKADENPVWQNGTNHVGIKVPENGLVVMEREL